MSDLTTVDGVRAYMLATTSEEDWNKRCLEVKAANDGSYPACWYEAVIVANVEGQVFGAKDSGLRLEVLEAPTDGQSMVRLKNGEEVFAALVTTVMISIDHLAQNTPIVLYELVMACRDREHRLFGRSGQDLLELSLIERLDENGCAEIHDSIRAIVESAAAGEDLDMVIGSPIAD